jgi:putative transcriptional regulator
MTDLNINLQDELAAIRNHRHGRGPLKTFKLISPSPPRSIREKMGLSQDEFASLLGVSKRTLQEWEQGRREPHGPALSLLLVAEHQPEALLNLPRA